MVLTVFCISLPKAHAQDFYSDGGTHTIDFVHNHGVIVRNSPSGQPTTVNLVTGGYVDYLYIQDSSKANISGGSIYKWLEAERRSQVSISGGAIGGPLYALESSQVTIHGSRFNRPYGTITGAGLLTGTLASGDTINLPFEIYNNARVVLVREPTTAMLLLLFPEGRECLSGGETFIINWSSTGPINTVLIEYSTDYGQNWTDVNTIANTGSYGWLVPRVTFNKCLIRISDVMEPNISDTSTVFAIMGAPARNRLVPSEYTTIQAAID